MTQQALTSLPFAQSSVDKVRGINGWVFEQVLLRELRLALSERGIKVSVIHQAPICGKATVDFVLGKIAVEAKVSGTYEDSRTKYAKYRAAVELKGWHYFYVTLGESYERNVRQAQEVFGPQRAFFLDRPGHWDELISAMIEAQGT